MGFGVVKGKRVYCGPGERWMKGIGCTAPYRGPQPSLRQTEEALFGLGPLKPVPTAVKRPGYVVKPGLMKAKATAKAYMKRQPKYRISKDKHRPFFAPLKFPTLPGR